MAEIKFHYSNTLPSKPNTKELYFIKQSSGNKGYLYRGSELIAETSAAEIESLAADLATALAAIQQGYETKTDATAKLTEAKQHTDNEINSVNTEIQNIKNNLKGGAYKDIDNSLSTSSTNPVENKAITNWLANNIKNYKLIVDEDGDAILQDSEVNPAAVDPDWDDGLAYSIAGHPLAVDWENVIDPPSASISQEGIVQLCNVTNSDSSSLAATANAVKQAYDVASKTNITQGSSTQPVYFDDGVPVAIGYTIAKSVPSNAKFTDTTYTEATTSKDGLMSMEDKTKVENLNIAYGTCSTAEDVAEKVVTLVSPGWELKTGALITVKFSETNSAEAPKLNVNGTGAKSIYYDNTVYTSSGSYGGYANRHITYQYDGTNWVFISWSYDTNSDTKVTQSAAITTAGEYPVILGYSTSTSSVTNTVKKTTTLKYNPSTKILTAPTFKGNLEGNASSATEAESATKATKDAGGNVIIDTYETKEAAAKKLETAKEYTDDAKDAAIQHTNDMVNAIVGEGAVETLDTIGEISAAITANQDILDTLNDAVGKKANKDDLTSHTGNSAIHFTADERDKLKNIASGAEVNQKAFSNIKIGNTTIAADTKTDTLELVEGDYITLTPDATNDKVTFSIPEASTTSKGVVQLSDSTSTTSSDIAATSTAVKSAYDLANSKQNKITGAATTITDSNLTVNRALLSNSSGKVAVSAVTSTELGYLSGVTDKIQTQLNNLSTNQAGYLPLTGGTMKQKTGIKWEPENNLTPYLGHCTQSNDGTFVVGSLKGTVWNTGLAIGGGSGNLLWKGAKVATVDTTELTNYLPLTGGNMAGGHIYLTGSQASNSTGNTTQIVFGKSNDQHVALSSNNNALVINPSSTETSNADDGASQIVLYLNKASTFPKGISGNLSGNASTATQFASDTTVSATGDATGTSAASKRGWSIPLTLVDSGVTAGKYGPSANTSPTHGGTFSVPYITVDAKGRVTAASTKTITLPSDSNTHYTTGITAGATGTTSNSAVSNPFIKIKDDSTHRGQIQIKGGGATSVSSDANGVITISSTDNNTTYTSLKNPYALTVQGNGTQSFTYDGSVAKTLNIKAGTNVSVSSDTSGNITISSTDTNTTYGVATSSVLGLVKSGTDITVDSSGNVSVVDGSHNHSAGNITSGTLAVTRGGTGVTSNPSMLINLASTSAASVFAASPRPGVTGVLPLTNGGTGANLTYSANGIIRFSSSGSYFSSTPTANGAFYATSANGSPSFGTLPIAQGGTGATSIAGMLNKLCNDDTSNASPGYVIGFNADYQNSGYTSMKNLRNSMGLGNTTDALPIANGGTGATTAAGAISNIGAMDLTSAQTASGVKTFSNGIKIGSATLSYNSTASALVLSFS